MPKVFVPQSQAPVIQVRQGQVFQVPLSDNIAVSGIQTAPTSNVANIIATIATDAFNQANAAFSEANNTTANSSAAFNQANQAFTQANTGTSIAQSAYGFANTTAATLVIAYQTANNSYNVANSAFNTANAAVPKTGGTITGDLSITGNLFILGNSTSVNTQSILVEDSLLVLASNNQTNLVDIGTVGQYAVGSNIKFTGLVRSNTTNTWYLFESANTIGNNQIDFANVVISQLNTSIISANIIYQGTQLGTTLTAVFGEANSATSVANAAIIQANNALNEANIVFGIANTALQNTANITVNTNIMVPGYANVNVLTANMAVIDGVTINGPAGSIIACGTIQTTGTMSASQLFLQGNRAVNSWINQGVVLYAEQAVHTDNSTAANTVIPIEYISLHDTPTLAFTSSNISVGSLYTLYVKNPAAGANVTVGNLYAFGSDTANIGLTQFFSNGAISIRSNTTGQYTRFNENGTLLARNYIFVGPSVGNPLDAYGGIFTLYPGTDFIWSRGSNTIAIGYDRNSLSFGAEIFYSTQFGIGVRSTGVMGFYNADRYTDLAGLDTAFSRLSAGVLALGNGSANNITGTLSLSGILRGVLTNANVNSTILLDLSKNTVFNINLTANVTATLQNCVSSVGETVVTVYVKQGIGSNTITWQGNTSTGNAGTVRWSNNAVPVQSPIVNNTDIYQFRTPNNGQIWFANRLVANT